MHKNFCQLIISIISYFLIALYAVPSLAAVQFTEECMEGKELNLPVCKWEDTATGGTSRSRAISNRGTVLLIHGITQRAYSLNCLARQLAEEGFTVYGIDQRGHGRWHFLSTKKDVGYKCNFKQTVKDVDLLLPVLKQTNPDQPIFLIGESAGAGVAIRSAGDMPELVRGVVLAGTGCKTGHVKLTWFLGDLLSNFYRLDHQINVVRYQKRYGTDDLPALEESLKDSWQRPTMSAREMFRAAKFMKKNAKFARRISPETSVLVVQGCDDKVLKPQSAQKVLANIPSADKRIVNIAKCGHILLGTNRLKPAVVNSITAWLERGVGETTVASLDGVVTH
ncbi:MAG: alpha/beta fold hydrolase [Cyanobacteria bacterium SZAS LIN-5]|nr:alpha/beta fold hydrolase [Cyanobacteria bacterium SZAS LIN-5]